MRKALLAFLLTIASASLYAAPLQYEISSPDDLSNITVGETVRIDVYLNGISANTWNDTAIFNAFVIASDEAHWSNPFNAVFNSALNLVFTPTSPGRQAWVHVDTPLTMLTDFVVSFDITAIAVGAGTFFANGADIFRANVDSDAQFTNGARVEYNIVAVPEPGVVALLGLGLLGMSVSRRRRCS